ncbi:EcsC family protein [Mucilaginibacter hurinus]|nr:EcsC family protein [Mucilaginibacter hurinus]
MKLKKISDDIKEQANKLADTGFRQIFNRIDQLHIKKGVDSMGLDKFIEQCALIAAGSGAVSGSGGLITMVVGMPLDMLNLISQQFRVTMAITYYNRGSYKIGFVEFMKIVAASFKVEAGVAASKTVMEAVAEKLIMKLGARAARRLVPVVGAVIGGTANYIFIKRMAKTVKELHPDPVVIQVN